jgi:hypothetical protein
VGVPHRLGYNGKPGRNRVPMSSARYTKSPPRSQRKTLQVPERAVCPLPTAQDVCCVILFHLRAHEEIVASGPRGRRRERSHATYSADKRGASTALRRYRDPQQNRLPGRCTIAAGRRPDSSGSVRCCPARSGPRLRAEQERVSRSERTARRRRQWSPTPRHSEGRRGAQALRALLSACRPLRPRARRPDSPTRPRTYPCAG